MQTALDENRLASYVPKVRDAIANYVRRVSTDLTDEVVSITLYGSQARGEAEVESDIDLFIVVRHDMPTLREALADIAWQVQFGHGVVISDIIRSESQLRQMRQRRFPYYQSVEREGILLWKNTSEAMPGYA
jgi:predicted nucleotidyltransferase